MHCSDQLLSSLMADPASWLCSVVSRQSSGVRNNDILYYQHCGPNQYASSGACVACPAVRPPPLLCFG